MAIQRSDEMGPCRRAVGLHLNSLREFPLKLEVQSTHFVLCIAMDGSMVSDEEVSAFANSVLSAGAVWVEAWGKDCERIHDVFDEVYLQRTPEFTDHDILMTTWHADESLADAVWFSMYTAFAPTKFEETCTATLLVTIGNPDWARQIDGWIRDPESLN